MSDFENFNLSINGEDVKITMISNLFNDNKNAGEAKSFFIEAIREKLQDLDIRTEIILKYNRYNIVRNLLKSVLDKECLVLYSDDVYGQDIVSLPKSNVVDTVFVPLNLSLDEIIESVISYKIKSFVIIDPYLSMKARELQLKLPNYTVTSFTEFVVSSLATSIGNFNETCEKKKEKFLELELVSSTVLPDKTKSNKLFERLDYLKSNEYLSCTKSPNFPLTEIKLDRELDAKRGDEESENQEYYPGDSIPDKNMTKEQLDKELDEYMKQRKQNFFDSSYDKEKYDEEEKYEKYAYIEDDIGDEYCYEILDDIGNLFKKVSINLFKLLLVTIGSIFFIKSFSMSIFGIVCSVYMSTLFYLFIMRFRQKKKDKRSKELPTRFNMFTRY